MDAVKASEDARITRSRAALRAALLDLLDRHPFPAITAVMIAEAAGVGYATFFRRYPDPAALLLEVADDMIQAALAAMAPATAGDDLATMQRLARFVAANRGVAYALLVGAGAEIQQAVTERAVARAAAVEQRLEDGLPPELAVRMMVAGAVALLGWWLGKAPDTPPERIAELLVRLVVAPARGSAGHDDARGT